MANPSRAAHPKVYGGLFDAWNSSSTGHQRAENKLGGSTGWRQSRAMKLSRQFQSRGTGGKRISDQAGAGSEDWDEKTKALIPKSVREGSKASIKDMLLGQVSKGGMTAEERLMAERSREDELKEQEKLNHQKKVFDELVIYINGSTYPLVGDHKLKQMLAENGARLSLHLGRRTVTHVIIGKRSGSQGAGAGGGLSGTKIEKEIRRVGGCGVKYVDVTWVLESIKAGKRLPEAPFTNLKVAAKGQQSVYSMFQKSNSAGSSDCLAEELGNVSAQH